MPRLDLDAHRWIDVHVVSEAGAGPPAVLVHSGGFTSRQWRRLADALAPTHHVLAPDLLGYGASTPWPPGQPFHFREDLAALVALLDTLAEPAHLVGHSYGGFLALQAALARPARVRSIAAYEPVAFGILDEPDDAALRAPLATLPDHYDLTHGADDAWLEAFVDWWNGAGAWRAMGDDARASFRALGWKVFQEVMSLVADRTDRAGYAAIGAPTLILGGGRSPATERRVLDKLVATLPHARLELFPDHGHMGPITAAARVNTAILEHLRA
jgi:pimeloyl-ACP methyl ester carboxylesterase